MPAVHAYKLTGYLTVSASVVEVGDGGYAVAGLRGDVNGVSARGVAGGGGPWL
jgi:hypothetical protein